MLQIKSIVLIFIGIIVYNATHNTQEIYEGYASYYNNNLHGRPTASGEMYDKHKLTGAHKIFKFGTRVKVTNLLNDQSVIVRINDRGPFIKNRIIDLSYAAAKKIKLVEKGIVKVRLEVLE